MKYTDLHCDTAYEIYQQRLPLMENTLHIDLNKSSVFERFTQVYAVWSENDKDDDVNYAEFYKTREYFLNQLNQNNIKLCTGGEQYKKYLNDGTSCAFLAVEGGKLLGQDITRVERLHASGVRFLTLTWNGHCCIGGAFNTHDGLSDFGRRVVTYCEQLGIIVDVSHLSEKGFFDLAGMAEKPFIATHSNSKNVFGHDRNLTDEQFSIIRDRGGVVGLSLCSTHVADEPNISGILRHLEHYLSLGGEDTVCFGCDFDGATPVSGITNAADMMKFPEAFAKIGYGNELIEKIMFRNADRFIINNL